MPPETGNPPPSRCCARGLQPCTPPCGPSSRPSGTTRCSRRRCGSQSTAAGRGMPRCKTHSNDLVSSRAHCPFRRSDGRRRVRSVLKKGAADQAELGVMDESGAYCSRPIPHCRPRPQRTPHTPLPATHFLPPAACDPLPTTHCLHCPHAPATAHCKPPLYRTSLLTGGPAMLPNQGGGGPHPCKSVTGRGRSRLRRVQYRPYETHQQQRGGPSPGHRMLAAATVELSFSHGVPEPLKKKNILPILPPPLHANGPGHHSSSRDGGSLSKWAMFLPF